MGDLANRFGGRQNGELIRAADWNGLIDGIETQLGVVESRLGARIEALVPRIAAAESRLDIAEKTIAGVTQSLVPLQTLADSLLARQRRIDLSAAGRNAFAVGERAEIVARVTDLLGAPLNLADAATRPWIDFLTVWGTLKAAPGFKSVTGTGGRTVTVQVNETGEARVLLRAEAGEELAEEQEQEVHAVLATKIGTKTIAAAFLEATTPGASDLAPAFAAMTTAYQRADTPVMRNYIDARYLAKPVRAYTPLTPAFAVNWRDEYATVLAFMKPDDSPGTADGAMAVGSIRVTFRDWMYPWMLTQFLPVKPEIVNTYRDQFLPQIRNGAHVAVGAIWDVIEKQTRNRGILGTQREFAAAQEALATMAVPNPPTYLQGVVQAVGSGLAIQRSLAYGQAVAPLVAEDVTPARGVSLGAVRGEAAAVQVAEKMRAETSTMTEKARSDMMELVRAETVRLSNDLLREDGPVRRAENFAQSAKAQLETVSRELNKKAGMELVGQLLSTRGIRG